jgi:hypothetical protein
VPNIPIAPWYSVIRQPVREPELVADGRDQLEAEPGLQNGDVAYRAGFQDRLYLSRALKRAEPHERPGDTSRTCPGAADSPPGRADPDRRTLAASPASPTNATDGK